MDVATRMLRSAHGSALQWAPDVPCAPFDTVRSLVQSLLLELRAFTSVYWLVVLCVRWIPVMPRLGKRKLHMQRTRLVSIANCFPAGSLVSSCILRILWSGGVTV